jgi:transcriptional regulator with XRE-family HTH domain
MANTGMSKEEVSRITALLRDAIKLSKISNREVERQLNLSSGYLSRLFAGVMELRVQHVLDICTVIGFPAGEFFRAVYPGQEGDDPHGSKLRQALERLHPSPELEQSRAKPPAAPAADADRPSETDVERMLMSALRKLLTQEPGKA